MQYILKLAALFVFFSSLSISHVHATSADWTVAKAPPDRGDFSVFLNTKQDIDNWQKDYVGPDLQDPNGGSDYYFILDLGEPTLIKTFNIKPYHHTPSYAEAYHVNQYDIAVGNDLDSLTFPIGSEPSGFEYLVEDGIFYPDGIDAELKQISIYREARYIRMNMDTIGSYGAGIRYIDVQAEFPFTEIVNIDGPDVGSDEFTLYGAAVDISDDASVIAVAARRMNSYKGNVKVYRRTGDVTVEEFDLASVDSTLINGETAGWGLALSGDGKTLAIGSPGFHSDQSFTSRVRVYRHDGSSWTRIGYFNSGARDMLGGEVALSNDGNTLLIGTSLETRSNTGGQIQAYRYPGGSSGTTEQTWTALGSQIDRVFSGSLRLNSDGTKIVVGNPYYKNADNVSVGQVRTYQLVNNDWELFGEFPSGEVGILNGNSTSERYGRETIISGDGNFLVLVDSYGDTNGLSNNGFAKIYKYSDGQWELTQTIHGTQNNGYLGFSRGVDISENGDVLIISSRNAASYRGKIFLYKKSENDQFTLFAEQLNNKLNDFLGGTLKLTSDRKYVATSSEYDSNDQRHGQFHLYELGESVFNSAPSVTFTSSSLTTNEEVTVSTSFSTADPENDTVNVRISTQSTSGTAAIDGSNVIFTPNADFFGNTSFEVAAGDVWNTVYKTVNVTVTNVQDDPNITIANTLTTAEDTAKILNFTYTDADNDTVTAVEKTAPTHGTITINGTAISYTPSANYNGSDSFVLTLSDGAGYSIDKSINVTVTPVNDPPVISYNTDNEGNVTGISGAIAQGGNLAASGSFSFSEIESSDRPVASLVSSNMQVTRADGTTYLLTNEQQTAFEALFNITNGENNADTGSVSWSFAAANSALQFLGVNETLTLTYHIVLTDADGVSTSQPITLTVSGINDAPQPVVVSAFTMTEDTNDSLSYSVSDLDGDSVAVSISVLPTKVNLALDTTNALVQITPLADQNGTDSFTLQFDDGNGGVVQSTVELDIAPIDDAPRIVIDTTPTINEDTAVNFAYDVTDVDGQAISFNLSNAPTNGTVTHKAGQFTYTPNANFFGSDSFTVTLSDGLLSISETIDVTIDAVDDAPRFTVSQRFEDNSQGEPSLSFTTTDVENQAVTASISTHVSFGSVNLSNDAISYVPNAGFVGEDSFTIKLEDSNSNAISIDVKVLVTNTGEVLLLSAVEQAFAENTFTEVFSYRRTDLPQMTRYVTDIMDFSDDGNVLVMGDVKYNELRGNAYILERSSNDEAFTLVLDVAEDDVDYAGDMRPQHSQLGKAATVSDNGLSVAFSSTHSAIVYIYQKINGTWTKTGRLPQSTWYTNEHNYGYSLRFANDGNTLLVGSISRSAVHVFDYKDDPLNQGTKAWIGRGANNGAIAVSNMGNSSYITPDGQVVIIGGEYASTTGVNFNGRVQVFKYNLDTDAWEGFGEFEAAQGFPIVDPDNAHGILGVGEGARLGTTVRMSDDKTTLVISATSNYYYGTTELWQVGDMFVYKYRDEKWVPTFSAYASDTDDFFKRNGNGNLGSYDALTLSANGDLIIVGNNRNYFIYQWDGTTYARKMIQSADGHSTFMELTNDGRFVDIGQGLEEPHANRFTKRLTRMALPASIVSSKPVLTLTGDAVGANNIISLNEDTSVSVFVTASNGSGGGDVNVSLSVLPSHGSALLSNNVLTYTPNSHYYGYDQIVLTISDSNIKEYVVINFDINAINDLPTITLDTEVAFAEDTVASFDFEYSDIENDPVSASVQTSPAYGSITINNSTKSIQYEPNAHFFGSDQATFAFNDGTDSVIKTVNFLVTSVNDIPTIEIVSSVILEEDGQQNITFAYEDIDGDEVTGSVFTQPNHGEAYVIGQDITYIPSSDFFGNDQFTLTFIDEGGYVSLETISVYVEPVNDAPNIEIVSLISLQEDGSQSLRFSYTDIDSDIVSAVVTTAPASGEVEVNGTEVSYLPELNFNGMDSFILTLTDGDGYIQTETITVNVLSQNDNPTIDIVNSIVVAEDGTQIFSFTYTDVDNDTVTASIKEQASHGIVTVSGTRIRYIPENNYIGPDMFVIELTDGNGYVTEEQITVTVTSVNDVPNILLTTRMEVSEDQSQSLVFTYEDIDQDVVTAYVSSAANSGFASVEGTTITYTPSRDFVGEDNFELTLTDNNGFTTTRTISVTVNGVNDQPVLNDDTFFVESPLAQMIDVLSNDFDIDSNNLTLMFASAQQGEASVVDNQVRFVPPQNYRGVIRVKYVVQDEQGASATANLDITLDTSDTNAPRLTVPADLVVPAEGAKTVVELGVAQAVDVNGKSLNVSLLNSQESYLAGRHLLVWKTTDDLGRSSEATQILDIVPKVTLIHRGNRIMEGERTYFTASLSGDAPSYPFVVPFTVSGSINANEHSLKAGEITFFSKKEQKVVFEVFNDEIVEGEETLTITLQDLPQENNEFSIIVTEEPLEATVDLHLTQDGEERLNVFRNNGEVTISTELTRISMLEQFSFNWTNDISVVDLDSQLTTFTFDPSNVEAAKGNISLEIVENATGEVVARDSITVSFLTELPDLSDDDTDGDGIPDFLEGLADNDMDGLANFLDSLDQINLQLSESGYLQTEPGIRIIIEQSEDIRDLFEFIANTDQIPGDIYTLVNKITEFMIDNLPETGMPTKIAITQSKPIPENAVYRKYNRERGWFNFIVGNGNAIHSARGSKGVCPEPNSPEYTEGLTPGDWCVQLTIVDGGPNDSDGEANRVIRDPGGVAVLLNNNTLPILNEDYATLPNSQDHVLDVLANDTDADGDVLELIDAQMSQGQVEIIDNQLSLSLVDTFVGDVIVTYFVNDGGGVLVEGRAILTVIGNEAPIAFDDTASTNDRTPITVNVLANDTDPDLDELTVASASASYGSVAILDNAIVYSPEAGFSGEDLIVYTIVDPSGEEAQAQLVVSVEAYQDITITTSENNNSAGSISYFYSLLLLCSIILRRSKGVLILLAVFALISFKTHAQTVDESNLFFETTYSSLRSDLTVDKLNRKIDNTDITLHSFENETVGYSLTLGHYFSDQYWMAIGYQHFSDFSITWSADTITPEQAFADIQDIQAISGRGITVTLGKRYHLTNHLFSELILGVFDWESEITITSSTQQTVVDDKQGISPFVGFGAGLHMNSNIEVLLSYRLMSHLPENVGISSLAIRWRF